MKKGFTTTLVCILAFALVFIFGGCELLGLSTGTGDPAVYISQVEITLAVGDSIQLAAVSTDNSVVDWLSLDENIATVSDNGLVTGVAKGETMVMAFTDSDASTFCTIKVTDRPEASGGESEVLTLTLPSIAITVGSNVTLTAQSSTGAEITWASSNPTVATVNQTGRVVGLAVGTTVISASTGTATATCNVEVTSPTPVGSDKTGYKLVWYDEFDGASLDTTKWNYQTGTRDIYHGFDTQNWNWGNDEEQYYTQDSVRVSGGSLVITATKQSTEGKEYKSGRILTRDLASWTYGYFEAKIKTPTGSGMWPAFWMLPQPSSFANVENKYGGWPYNGEIDIMEAKGRLMNKVDTTLHFGPISADTWQSKYVTAEKELLSNTDQWHTYAVEWKPNYIKWFVDGVEVQTVGSGTWYSLSPAAAGNASAPFDQPFYIILNLAVGGRYDNYNTPAATFTSASMYVDYVRVYESL